MTILGLPGGVVSASSGVVQYSLRNIRVPLYNQSFIESSGNSM